MKLIIPLLILLFFLSAWGTGDINNDGRVNSYDCHLAYQGGLTLAQAVRADVNHDFIINQRDVEIIFDSILHR
jgi:hypothetical protein